MTKPICETAFISAHRDLKNDYYSVTLDIEAKRIKASPGQFVHIEIPCSEIYFRRAFSIANVSNDGHSIELIFKVFGRGTKAMGALKKNDKLSLLGPLGSSFTPPKKTETMVIVAGGVGFPPLLYFASEMVKRGFDPKRILFFYGGRSSADIIEKLRIKKLGLKFLPVTEDGTLGTKGLVTVAVENYLKELDQSGRYRIYSCGPEGMLKATDELAQRLNIPGEVSLEAPMPCGLGICLGCVVNLRQGGHARVCREGPVFDVGEVLL